MNDKYIEEAREIVKEQTGRHFVGHATSEHEQCAYSLDTTRACDCDWARYEQHLAEAIASALRSRDEQHRREVEAAYTQGFNEARLVAEQEVYEAHKPFRHVTRDYQDVDQLRDAAMKRIRAIEPSRASQLGRKEEKGE